MINLNLLFNKTYYTELGKNEAFSRSVEMHNDRIFNTVFDHEKDYRPSEVCSENGKNRNEKDKKLGLFLLKTLYPGLLVGSGNPHCSNLDNNDIRFGFSFDYVSGQPYIPGSSVKGVLHSKFKYTPEVVAEVLESFCDFKFEGNKIAAVKVLEKDIFEGKDVFLDAVIYDGEPKYGRLMGADYITPHSSPIKNPIPVLFTKVLPNVRFEFRFKLTDSELNGKKLTAAKKKYLFKELLKLFGVGAKTNVGYGVFDDCNDEVLPKMSLNTPLVPSQTSTDTNTPNEQKTEFKKCTQCQRRIYKKDLHGNDNYGWKYDICYQCRKTGRG